MRAAAGADAPAPAGLSYSVVATRFTNLMPNAYVDVVVPELPPLGTKMSNSVGVGARRVLARVPLASTPGGSQHFQPNETQLLRTHFSPITLSYLTIELFGSDGEPYDSRDTPHSLTIELVELVSATPARAPRSARRKAAAVAAPPRPPAGAGRRRPARARGPASTHAHRRRLRRRPPHAVRDQPRPAAGRLRRLRAPLLREPPVPHTVTPLEARARVPW